MNSGQTAQSNFISISFSLSLSLFFGSAAWLGPNFAYTECGSLSGALCDRLIAANLLGNSSLFGLFIGPLQGCYVSENPNPVMPPLGEFSIVPRCANAGGAR